MHALSNVLNRLNNINAKKRSGEFIPSGFKELDDILGGFQKGNLYIIASTPCVGKTALLVSAMCNMIYHQPLLFIPGIISLDIPAERWMARMLSNITGVYLEKIERGKLFQEELELLKRQDIFERLQAVCIGSSCHMSMHDIEINSAQWAANKHIDILFIDCLQMITRKKYWAQDYKIFKTAKDLKKLALDLQIPIICSVQINVYQKSSPKLLRLADLRNIGPIEQSADTIIFLHRPEFYQSVIGETHFRIAKNNSGTLETLKLKANLHVQRFEEFNS
jgi:replicative DNA helicase